MRYNFTTKNGNYMSKKAKQYSATEKTKIVLEGWCNILSVLSF